MGGSPDKDPLGVMLSLGATDISIRALEFDPPMGPRPTGKEVPVRWSVTLTPKDHGRPTVRALRPDALEALVACAERALLVYKAPKGAVVDTVDTGEAPKPKKPKPAPKPPVDDDDIDDLI